MNAQKSRYAREFDFIQSVQIADDHTVIINFKEPVSDVVRLFDIWIIPGHLFILGNLDAALSCERLIEGSPGVVDGEIWLERRNLLSELPGYCRRRVIDGRVVIEKDVFRWKKIEQTNFSGIRGSKSAMVFQEPKSSLSPYFCG